MGIASEIVKVLCTDSGKSFVKNVATGVLSIMVAKAIVDANKVNKKISSFERDLDRAEAAIDEALGKPRRRYREDDDYEDRRYSRERDRYYRTRDDDREYTDERPRRDRREYSGRRR